MKKFVLLAVVATLLVNVVNGVIASAFVIGPSNFISLGYPDHNCHKPVIPYSRDSFSVSMFKMELENYMRCINNYVDAAKNDRARIIEKSNEAVDEYNDFIRSISR